MDWIDRTLDINAEHGVLVQVRADRKVLWVSVDGVTALRVSGIPEIVIEDPHSESVSECHPRARRLTQRDMEIVDIREALEESIKEARADAQKGNREHG